MRLLLCLAFGPYPDHIRMQLGQCILIRNSDPVPERSKESLKRRKISSFKVLGKVGGLFLDLARVIRVL